MPAIRMPESWNGTISALRGKTGTTSQPGPPRRAAAAPSDPSSQRRPEELAERVARWVTRDKYCGPAGAASEVAGDSAADATMGRQVRRTGARLTGRGGVVAVFAASFAGAFAATAWHIGVLTGSSYVAACVFAAFAVRRNQLLPVVVLPPMLLGAAVVCVQAITASGGLLSAAGGTLVTLGNVAPWLFAGTVLGVIIAMARGLAGNISALRESLRGDSRDQDRTRGRLD